MSEKNAVQSDKLFENLKWDADGLIACVVQDAQDGAVLMVAYMNRDSLQKTLEGKKDRKSTRLNSSH